MQVSKNCKIVGKVAQNHEIVKVLKNEKKVGIQIIKNILALPSPLIMAKNDGLKEWKDKIVIAITSSVCS